MSQALSDAMAHGALSEIEAHLRVMISSKSRRSKKTCRLLVKILNSYKNPRIDGLATAALFYAARGDFNDKALYATIRVLGRNPKSVLHAKVVLRILAVQSCLKDTKTPVFVTEAVSRIVAKYPDDDFVQELGGRALVGVNSVSKLKFHGKLDVARIQEATLKTAGIYTSVRYYVEDDQGQRFPWNTKIFALFPRLRRQSS